jgi:hypothetical protein
VINHEGIGMEKFSGSALRWAAIGGIAAAATLAACGGGGGSGGSPVPQGSLQMSMMDAPGCYQHVYVTVEKVRVHTSATAGDSDAGWQDLTLASPQRIDLLTLNNGAQLDLGTTQLPAGDYQQIRLVLADNAGTNPPANSVQPNGGAEVPLKTPSGQQSGLKLLAHFTVQPNQTTSLVLDFDACKSVVFAGNSGQYLLKPVMSLTPRVSSSIQGYVTTTLAVSGTAVSAQQDGTVVRSTVPDSSGKFVLSSLPGGTYTVVINSDGHASGVITSVPVGTATTSVNGTATAIVLPTSVMNTVTGTVTATSVNGSTTTTVPVTDARVTATQALSSGGSILVGDTQVDADLATYTFHLPAAAPMRAPYASGGLNFSADSTSAGKYTLRATAPGRSTLQQDVDVSSGAATANFGY